LANVDYFVDIIRHFIKLHLARDILQHPLQRTAT